jgi:hypothetical protein
MTLESLPTANAQILIVILGVETIRATKKRFHKFIIFLNGTVMINHKKSSISFLNEDLLLVGFRSYN